MPTITKNDILLKIAAGEPAEAIEYYKLLAEESGDKRHKTDAVLISGRYAILQQDFSKGIITREEVKIEEARIMNALQTFANKLPDDLTVTLRGIVKPKPDAQTSPERTASSPTPPGPMPQNQGSKKVLFLGANPEESTRLRIDQEARDIDEGLRLARHRDRFQLTTKWAVRSRDLRRALLEENPQIVHFSGHGAGADGLVLENDAGEIQMVSSSALGALFGLFSDQIECVLLNACYSEAQANEIVQHIPYVIGMNKAVPDKTAIEFAVAFYDALGNGKDYEFAFRLGCAAVEMAGLSGALIPVL